MEGIGNPEPLRGNLQGEFSRRINDKDRLVYHLEDGRIYIAACRGHYGDK
jgi:toxin YoeB